MTSSAGPAWHLITGEYPPQRGGVSDYTATLARALAEVGCEVHVWAPPMQAESEPQPLVHRLPDVFGVRGLRALDGGLDACTSPRVLLVQYVPHAFGRRGMNVGFCRWVRRRARFSGDDVRVMFHEPYFPFTAWPLHHNVLAAVNRFMAFLMLSAARMAYVSTMAWAPRLRRYAPRALPFVWLPIPSSIPALRDGERVMAIRRLLAPDPDTQVVGHFGTYGPLIVPTLLPTIRYLLNRRPDVRVCLLGTHSDSIASESGREDEHLARVIGMGYQSPSDIAASLQACDVVVQPYADGASGRRTTLMAALANGVAVVTNHGAATEDVWSEGGIVLAGNATPAALGDAIVDLLHDEGRRARTAASGRALYENRFAIGHTVDTLLASRGATP